MPPQRGWSTAIAGMLGSMVFAAQLLAQTGQGTIVGLVRDATGAVIPSVSVLATNPVTGFTYRSATNEEGLYRIPYVNPATYEITFEAQGFKKLVRSNIVVRATETARVDVQLEVGSVVESVEVQAVAPLLESETSVVGHLVTGTTLNRLPTPQMKVESMLWYVPGVTGQRGSGHAAGGRSRAFVITNDGVSGMNPGTGTIGTGFQMSTVEYNMEEIKVLTTALPAEYGHSGGGIMSITYKSGTNQLHGLAEERYMNKNMIHRNWQDPNIPTGLFGFHLMSGSLSGPVYLPKMYNGRNRTFFLFGFQRHHEKASENNDRDVPSPEMLAGDFSFPQSPRGVDIIYDPATLVRLPNGNYTRTPFPGNRIPTNRFDPVAVKFLSFNPFTAPNNRNNQTFYDSTGPRNNLSADTVYRSYRTSFDTKIDHSFSDRHKIFGRYSNFRHRSFNGRWQVQVANPIFDHNVTPIPINQRQVVISDSITINPTTIQELRLGFNRRKFTRVPESLGQNWAAQLGIPNVSPETMPTFLTATGGEFYFRFPEGRSTDVNENWSIQDNVTMVRGRHTFKTGFEVLRTRLNSAIPAEPSGRYWLGGTELPFTPNTGNRFANFLLGTVVRADFTRDLATWLPRWWSNAFYFQDDWKATPKLTFNLGLRWQYESPYNTKYGQQSQFDPQATDPLTGRKGAITHPKHALAKKDWNNFQPRIGMAYNFSPTWVFRGGFAINTLDLWTNSLRENFDEYLATATIAQPPGNPDIVFRLSQGPPRFQFQIDPGGFAPFIGTNYAGRSASYYDPNMRMPYIANWNAGFQHQIGSNWLVELNYQGSAGVGLLNRWDINAIPLDIASDFATLDAIRRAAQNYRPYPQFGSIFHYSNYGHSSFHSGTIKVERRYGRGFTVTSFYTFSKSLDEDSDDGAAGGVTFYNRRLEKGRSDHDVTHRWVTYGTYELPFGRGRRFMNSGRGLAQWLFGNWELAAIQTLESGAPFGFAHNGRTATAQNVYLPMALRPDMAPGKTYKDIRLDWDRRGNNRHNAALIDPWADINAFAIPPSFTAGGSGRNILSGPGLVWHQVSLSKTFVVKERVKGSLRYDLNQPFKIPFFNVPTNTVDFRNPQNFGKITSTQGSFSGLGGRTYMQVIFKLEF